MLYDDELLMIVLHDRVYFNAYMYISGINIIWSFSFQNHTPSINCKYHPCDKKMGIKGFCIQCIHKTDHNSMYYAILLLNGLLSQFKSINYLAKIQQNDSS